MGSGYNASVPLSNFPGLAIYQLTSTHMTKKDTPASPRASCSLISQLQMEQTIPLPTSALILPLAYLTQRKPKSSHRLPWSALQTGAQKWQLMAYHIHMRFRRLTKFLVLKHFLNANAENLVICENSIKSQCWYLWTSSTYHNQVWFPMGHLCLHYCSPHKVKEFTPAVYRVCRCLT